MRKKSLLFVGFFLLIHSVHAKKPLGYLGLAVNNFVCAKPISGFPKLFYSQFHPGITVSSGFNWTVKPKHNWMQSFKVGYFSHRYVQRSIFLYSEFGYRYKTGKWGYSLAAGLGYLHMIPGTAQFRQDENGDWNEIKLRSRPQGLISLSMGVDYLISQKGNRLFIRYQNILQTPFVPGYVPLLPYNVFHLGTTIPMSQILKKGGADAK